MPIIRPISEMRDTSTMSKLCHQSQEPVFLTKNGLGNLVVMSMECYEAMQSNRAIDTAIEEAETEYQTDGVLLDARETLGKLRKKHFG